LAGPTDEVTRSGTQSVQRLMINDK
jgi:hypothetical protein